METGTPREALVAELRALRASKGGPSTKKITVKATLRGHTISLSTVYDTFADRRVPRWQNVAIVVDVLGGDLEHFKPLWIAAEREKRAASLRRRREAAIGQTEPSPRPA